RKRTYSHALYSFTDEHGYINLKLELADGRKKAITTFENYPNGKSFLESVKEEYHLCPKLIGIDEKSEMCNSEFCLGACKKVESVIESNYRIQKMINHFSFENKSLAVIDKGRAIEERSVLLIEEGIFKGLGYINLNYQISNKKVLESLITEMDNTKDSQHI